MRTEGSGSRLRSIDALRGIAALAVVVSHVHFSWTDPLLREELASPTEAFSPALLAVTIYGRFGVGLFLLISGFCIHMTWARVAERPEALDFLRFWRRRLLRLYPPYALALACTVAGLFVLYGVIGRADAFPLTFGYPSGSQLATDITSSLALLQNVTGASPRLGNGPFWTLALEEQLYLLYFVLLAVRWRAGWRAALALVIGATLAWRALALVFVDTPVLWYEFGPARWLEWVLGALAVEAYLGRVVLPRWASSWGVAAVLGVLAVAVNAPVTHDFINVPSYRVGDPVFAVALLAGDLFAAAAFFVALNAVLAREILRAVPALLWRALATVGVFSYSLYLTHTPALHLAKAVAMGLGLNEGGIVQTALMVGIRLSAALGAAAVFYLLIERPSIRASRTVGVLRPIQRATPTAIGAPPIPASGASSSSAGSR